MTKLLLTISEATADAALAAAGTYDEVFLWSTSARSTFTGSIDPHLAGLGAVNPKNVDLVRIAQAVFASDRSVLREARGSDWNAREFEVSVEVGDPDTWRAHHDELASLVGFLTGDTWAFKFLQADGPASPPLAIEQRHLDRTVLLSGGADSATGALLSGIELRAGGSQALVSHFSATAISPTQQGIVAGIASRVDGLRQVHHQFHFGRRGKRLDGTDFRSETSSRSRSLLFLSLGLGVAERAHSPLWIAENGFASLNPPLGPDRRGSLSTHTTHPRFLRDLSALVTAVGGHGLIENPFERITKGEMFARVEAAIGAGPASAYLSATNSCSHTDARYSTAPTGSSCGVCFGCIVRRAAFTASGVTDATTYLSDDTTGTYDAFVRGKSIIEPVRDFISRGVRPRDVMTMSLPADYPPREALDLCARGVDELRSHIG